MAGFENDIMFAKNSDYSQSDNQAPVESNGLFTNGQLWIGRTAVNAGGTHIDVGTLTQGPGVIITNGPGSIIVGVDGSVVGQTITGDDGVVLSPTGGNWNIFGQDAGAVSVMDTNGSVSTLRVEDRTWTTQYVVDPSATVGLRGTFSTIQAAITAASAGTTIFIRPGTYTENLTLKSGVNLVGYANSFTTSSPVVISGKATLTSGSVAIDNIYLKTNGDYILDNSGSAKINLYRCFISNSSHAFLSNSGFLNFIQCNLQDTGASSGAWFTCTNSAVVELQGCNFKGTSTTVSTFANSSAITIRNSTFQSFISTSNTAQVIVYNSSLSAPGGQSFLTTTGTTLTNEIHNSYIFTDTISVGSGTQLTLSNVVIDSGNSNPITGAGTVKYSGLTFVGTGSGINTTTQVPSVSSNDALKIVTPGAYPYTTVPQDAVILVDSSSARTITPLASPTTGQRHVIKDNVGSAGTNNITITPSGKNIDGAASFVMNVNYGSVTIVYNGTQWNII